MSDIPECELFDQDEVWRIAQKIDAILREEENLDSEADVLLVLNTVKRLWRHHSINNHIIQGQHLPRGDRDER